MSDEVLKELWEVKDQIAREALYDTVALLTRLQDAQKKSNRTIVDFSRPHDPPATAENQTPQTPS